MVNEDGLTLVTRGGTYGKTLRGGMASKRFQRSGETARNRGHKKEKKEEERFYGFQNAAKQHSGMWFPLLLNNLIYSELIPQVFPWL